MILLGGVYSLVKIKTGLFPDTTFPKIKIIADNGEQPVDKMMVTVTVPIENAIKKVEELNVVRSTTSRGSCEISAFMDWNADIDLSKQQIESSINQVQAELPPAGRYRWQDRGHLRGEDDGPRHGPARELPDRPGRQDCARDRHAQRRRASERDERGCGEAQRTLTSDSPQLQFAFNEQSQPHAQRSNPKRGEPLHPPGLQPLAAQGHLALTHPTAGNKSPCKANGVRN